MQLVFNTNEKTLLMKGLNTLDTPLFNKQTRVEARKLVKRIKNSIPMPNTKEGGENMDNKQNIKWEVVNLPMPSKKDSDKIWRKFLLKCKETKRNMKA